MTPKMKPQLPWCRLGPTLLLCVIQQKKVTVKKWVHNLCWRCLGANVEVCVCIFLICRVGQNHKYTVYIRCIYTVLANPTYMNLEGDLFVTFC